jgi:uncharacterized iron-regulated protein
MPSVVRTTLVALISLLLFAVSGCVPPPPALGNPQLPYPGPQAPEVGEILHLATGVSVSEAQMLGVLSDARIVYVGETHDNPASHRLELAVLQEMARRYPDSIALGMEMFTPSQQEVLDDWVAGRLDEKTFLKRVRWFEAWGMDFDYYRELLDFARREKIPVLGLNAEKSLVSAVKEKGLAGLSDEERQLLPEMDLEEPYQRAQTTAIFGGHDQGGRHLERFLQIQTLWDETMAANIAAYLASPAGSEKRLVVVAGGNHVRYGFGIPRRVFRRLPTSYALVGTREILIPEEKQDAMMDVETPDFPMRPYDFVLYCAYEILEKTEVKLGVLLGTTEGQVAVEGVVPESSAAAAGLQKGDLLLAIDGEAIGDSFDLIYAVKQKRPGDSGTLLIEREGKEESVEVLFQEPRPIGPHGLPKK